MYAEKTNAPRFGYALRAPLGTDYLAEPEDILDTKQALGALGYYRTADGGAPGAWVDNSLFDGIRRFQNDNGLKVDGFMRPGGETEKAMNAALGRSQKQTDNVDSELPQIAQRGGRMLPLPVPLPPFPKPPAEGANDDDEPANENSGPWGSRGRRPRGGDDNRGGSSDKERRDGSQVRPGGMSNGQCYGQYLSDMGSCDSLWDYDTDIDMNRHCKEVAAERYDNCRFHGEWNEPPLPRWRVYPKRPA